MLVRLPRFFNMSKIHFNWKVGTDHLCKITNPQKLNYGKIVIVHRGNYMFYSGDHDDWCEENYAEDDFVVTDVAGPSDVMVKVDNDNYWNKFTAETARMLFTGVDFSKMILHEKEIARNAVIWAKALTEELKNEL